VPVWQNYLVKIFSEERTVAALGIMMIGQNATKLVSAFLIVKVIERYSFSTNASAWLFVFVGVLFGVGGLFYFFTREEKEDEHIPPRHREPFLSHTITSVRQIAANRNFLIFLAGDFDYIAVIAVISFYANYATIYCGIEPAIAGGAFVGCIYVGSIFSTLVFGVRGVFSLRNKYQVSKVFSLSALIILIGFESYLGFFSASLLLGASRGIRSIAFMPAVKKLTGAEDSTSYFAVAPLVTLPFAFSLPLVYGKLLDSFPQLNGGEYHLIFAISMVLILVGFWSIRQTDFDR
ncbi:MAG: MFS transporter, partial [Proteobacteria bacterium]|nr:MFS transporter [Pseudomonadota bacterium]